jgi:CheY-like chemotaxis protein
MEMSKEVLITNNNSRKYTRPSERTALFILGIVGFIKGIFTSSATVIPRGRVLQHQGNYLSAGQEIRYTRILLVEDNPNRAAESTEAITNYYRFGAVRIFVAHAYDAALTFFVNEDVNLVIMDADLDDDDGDGAMLTQNFLKERPDLKILANSSSRISNLKLTGLGALEILGKQPDKLKMWLLANDPTGSAG